MNLKTYQAYTMAQALAAVKQDLGADAVILNTRTFRRGGFMGMGSKLIVEVTATPAEPRATARPPARQTPAMPLTARKAYAGAAESGSMQDRERIKRLALAMEETHRRQTPQPAASKPVEAKVIERQVAETTPQPAPMITVPLAPAPTPAAPPRPAAAQRFVLAPSEAVHTLTVVPTNPARKDNPPSVSPSRTGHHRRAASDAPPRPAPITEAMQTELAAIKTMVGQVLQRQTQSGRLPSPGMPKALFDMYLKLVGQDISDEIADQIVNRVRMDLDGPQLDEESAVRRAVLARLAEFIPTCDDPLAASSGDGRPLTIALIGPTGVGKTTTAAKLAATFKLRHGKKVGLVTADTYRIAAVEQLRTYANIIGLPLQVASSAQDMAHAVESLHGCDVVLIDTAGRSQNDRARIGELKRLIEAARPHQVHLVLSSTASEPVMLNEAEAFAAVGIDRVVLSKLDEAVNFGVLVNVIRRIGKQLSFVTTGQEVPDHIEAGQAARLAELVMAGGAEHIRRGGLVTT